MKFEFIKSAQNFIAENPMKIYPFLFIAGDAAWGSYGVLGNASPLWSAGAALGISCNILKIAFGKGGETAIHTPPDKFFGQSFLKFLKETTSFTLGLFHINYWKDLLKSFQDISLISLKDKFKKSISAPHKYPMDAGWLIIAAAGSCYVTDALNIFNFRENMGNPLEIAVGFNVIAASTIAFLTNRNDLAGRLLSLGSFISIPTAISTGHVGMIASIPLYFMGQYLLSRVIPENQSQFTIDENRKKSEAQILPPPHI